MTNRQETEKQTRKQQPSHY